MTPAFNNDHITYYHMDTQWSVQLPWIYFAHPDFVVVKYWVCAMYLFTDTINQIGPQIYQYVKFCAERVVYTLLGIPCNHIMAIIDQTNAEMLFIITANTAL